MKITSNAHRFCVWAALVAFVLSSLISSSSLGSCCCDPTSAKSRSAKVHAAERPHADSKATSAAIKACCAAHAHIRSVDLVEVLHPAAVARLAEGHGCDCALSCGITSPIAYEAIEPRNKSIPELDFLAVSFAPFALVENGLGVISGGQPLTSLDAQDRCARLCRWLK